MAKRARQRVRTPLTTEQMVEVIRQVAVENPDLLRPLLPPGAADRLLGLNKVRLVAVNTGVELGANKE
jgi:hypothetical protein